VVRQAAFLRAVNVGGRGIIKMADLQQAFVAAGAARVTTFIASGNIMFDAPADSDALRAGIARNVGQLLGAEPVIIYRSMRQLERLVARAPFGALTADRTLKLYVLFSLAKTMRRARFPLQLPKEGLEAIGINGADVLVVSRRKPTGWYGFPTIWIEKELGITSTARNWSTVARMVAREKRARDELPTTNSQLPKLA
jgi:uncharacterized protein (DUF1697 family)